MSENRIASIGRYKRKISQLKQFIRECVHENAALCDEINETQNKTIVYNEERKFLLKKLCLFDPHVEAEVEDLSHQLYNNSSNISVDRKTKKKVLETSIITDNTKKSSGAKSRKSSSKLRKKIVQPIPLDPTGRPIFPIELGSITIHSLGEVVSDRKEFHCEDAIYPVGYVSTKLYASTKDTSIKCMYTCKISDANGLPRFEIAADDNSIPIVGGTPDVCHSLLLQKVNNFLSINLVPIKPNGNAFFGLTHPTVLNLVQSSTGARKCSNYRWNKFEVAKNGDSYIEDTDFTLNYESLQRSIELHNYKMDEFYNSQKAKFI